MKITCSNRISEKMKVFSRSIVGVLMIGLLGCGGLFSSAPSTSNVLPDPHLDLYEAEDLRYDGKYREAIAQYEKVFKRLPRSPFDAEGIDTKFLPKFKYGLAFCYTKLAEVEDDIFLYNKAEAAVKESYQTATHGSDRAAALHLWGYILFRQARYVQACVKFERVVEEYPQYRSDGRALQPAMYVLGEAYLELGDKASAREAFSEFRKRLEIDLAEGSQHIDYELVYALGEVYLELGDKTAAGWAFRQVEARVAADLQEGYAFLPFDNDLYGLGKVYLELGDEVSARRTFTLLLKYYPDSPHKPEVERLLGKK